MADLQDLFEPLRDRPAAPSAGLAAIHSRARHLRRRRRITAGGVGGLVLVLAITLGAILATRSSPTRVITPGSTPITTNPARPFSGLGRLAVTTSTGVKILGGRRVVTIRALGASALAWSPDGETLAYLDGEPGRLWLAGLDGHSRPLLNAPVRSFAWSPAGLRIAVEPDAGGLLLVTPSGQTTTLVGPDSLVTNMQWAPDGHTLAYAQAFPPRSAGPALRTDRLYLRALTASAPTLVPYSPAGGDGIILGGWWPNARGLYLWPDPLHSASIAADGLDLISVSLPEANVLSLGTTLATPRVLAFSPDGSQVVVMTGGFRYIDQNKTLERCPVGSNQCTAIPQPAGSASVTPTWSPNGRFITLVRGASSDNPNSSTWKATTQLLILDARTGATQPAAASLSGVGDPEFSADSAHLLFQHDTGLWLLDVATGATRQVADGLVPLATQWPAAPAYAWLR